jgi:threonine dehydrogenase-like Zn-dependent dehydrogenase
MPPKQMYAWLLYGAGMENFGKGKKPVRVPVPDYDDDELLARVDACGLCFSDIKLIKAGGAHPRMHGRDLKADPTVPGHEVVLTIVGVGDSLKARFFVGQRFIVQADIFYRGTNCAFGYMLKGGLEQYVVLGEEVLRGDDGCYLIEVKEETGSAESCLTEPWACVNASYQNRRRSEIKKDGKILIINGGRPKTIQAVQYLSVEELLRLDEKEKFDDIIFYDPPSPLHVTQASKQLNNGGVLALVMADELSGDDPEFDMGRIHYDRISIYAGRTVEEAYSKAKRSELKSKGAALFVGAGGPMGQMHVLRALMLSDPPSKIVYTDISDERLAVLERNIGSVSGIELYAVNPHSRNDPSTELLNVTNGKGFADIVVLVPSAPLISEISHLLAPDGVLNIFAGLLRGTYGRLSVNAILHRSVSYIGRSGSSIADLEKTLELVESGRIPANKSVAAIGGIFAVWEAIKGVTEGAFIGKVVIYPNLERLPLTKISDTKERIPEIYDRLVDGIFWSNDAEKILFEKYK